MPITVSHQPAAAAVGGAAYAGGLGQYEKWLREQQLRETALVQQDIQQQRAIAAQQQSQAFGANIAAARDMADRDFRGKMFGAEMKRREMDVARARGFEVEDRDFAAALAKERDAGLADRMAADDDRRAAAARAAAEEAALKAAEDDRRAFIMGKHDSGEWKLDDASNRRLKEIAGERGAVLRDDRWTDTQKAEQLRKLESEYWDILENPAPPMPGEKPIPPADKFKSEAFPLEGPDGSIKWIAPDRNGAWREVTGFDAPESDATPSVRGVGGPSTRPGASKSTRKDIPIGNPDFVPRVPSGDDFLEWKKDNKAEMFDVKDDIKTPWSSERQWKEYLKDIEWSNKADAQGRAAIEERENQLPVIRNDAEFEAAKLPPGARFIGPDGNQWQAERGGVYRPLDPSETTAAPAGQFPGQENVLSELEEMVRQKPKLAVLVEHYAEMPLPELTALATREGADKTVTRIAQLVLKERQATQSGRQSAQAGPQQQQQQGPPVIPTGPDGDAVKLEILQQNPKGFFYIDAATQKTFFQPGIPR